MKSSKDRDKLIAQLKKTPIVQVACQRTGIHRATYYRWRQASKAFAKAADKALQEGRDVINDMAESQLISAIREQNFPAMRFWLQHHHPDYATRVLVDAKHSLADDPLTPEQEKLIERALKLAGLASGQKGDDEAK